MTRPRYLALAFVIVWFLGGGLGHFFATDFFLAIVPPWVPSPRAVVLVSGALELLGAFGILWHRTRRAAGIGLFLLTVAVTPANVFMLQHAERFPAFPYWVLVARLPVQVLLLACIWRATRPRRG